MERYVFLGDPRTTMVIQDSRHLEEVRRAEWRNARHVEELRRSRRADAGRRAEDLEAASVAHPWWRLHRPVWPAFRRALHLAR